MKKFNAYGYLCEELHTITLTWDGHRSVTLDGLLREDVLELQSCIQNILGEEQTDGVGTTS